MKSLLKSVSERRPNDAYMTPDPLARAIVHAVWKATFPHLHAARWLDPCLGDGAFARAMSMTWGFAPGVTMDIDPARSPDCCIRFQDCEPSEPFSVVLGNPPFDQWEEFVEKGLRVVEPLGYVAYLLRLSALGGQKRARTLWKRKGFAYLIPIAPRPSFTEDGKTDASEYGVFIWRRGSRAVARVLPPLIWEPRA